MDINTYREQFSSTEKIYTELRSIINLEVLNTELNRLREFTVEVDFWDNNSSA